MANKVKIDSDGIRKGLDDKGISLREFCRRTNLCSPSTFCTWLKEGEIVEERVPALNEALYGLGIFSYSSAIRDVNATVFDDLTTAVRKCLGLEDDEMEEEAMEKVTDKIYPKKFSKKCSDIYKFWGDQMPMMIMEESAEFAQAISKMERWHVSEGKDYDELSEREDALVDEMADILISIECARQMYGIRIDEVRKAIKKKQKKAY